MSEKFNTPILFLIFNRPDTTQQVFNQIKRVKPQHLYIAADAPRADKPGEVEDCITTRAIIEQVNWNCEVHTLFRDVNLGCRVAVSSTINWFFENVEEGIILEDDCLPDQSFFWFCQELLQKYRNDERVMHISGSNYQFGIKRGVGSYYFSRLAHIWGWATWRRAWQHYDVNMTKLPEFIKNNQIQQIFKDRQVQKNWIKNLTNIYNGANTWDYQWAFANLINNSYCIIPNTNMISNIGFGLKATNTVNSDDKLANMPIGNITKIIHPIEFIFQEEADHFSNTKVFNPPSVLSRIKAKIIRTLR